MELSPPISPRPNSRLAKRAASSTTSLPGVFNSAPEDTAPILQPSSFDNVLSVRPRSHNSNNILQTDHALRFTGAGRFWQPPKAPGEAADRSKAGNWRRWSDKGDRVLSKRRLSAFTAPVHDVQEQTYPYRENPTVPLLQRCYLDPARTDDGTASISDGSSSGLSRHASSVASVRSVRSLRVRDMPMVEIPEVQPESLALRIAKDERELRTAGQLRKLQKDEEERLAQLRETDEAQPVPNLSAVLPISRQTSHAVSGQISNASTRLPNQLRAAYSPPITSPSASVDLIHIMEDLQSTTTSTSGYWTDLQELNSIKSSNLSQPKTPELIGNLSKSGLFIGHLHPDIHEIQTPNESPSEAQHEAPSNPARSTPIAELPPTPIIPTPELDSATPQTPNPRELDNNDLFAELNSLISALPARSRTTIATSALTSAHHARLSTSSFQPHSTTPSPHRRSISTQNLTTSPATDWVELPTQSILLPPPEHQISFPPTPEHPAAIELSASASVCYRPPRRDVRQLYRRTRKHSDLGVYNTLPHEAYPLFHEGPYTELPAREYESDRRDLYSWDSVNASDRVSRASGGLRPDWNPVTGRGAGGD
ncbi:hypothetical protein MMC18_004452 [Xylographa bjoerkii]|nr:hypothetical protein [Xylographa bjoerkii]